MIQFRALVLSMFLWLPCAAVPVALAAVPVYDYEILERRPHARENYVQGLEIHGDSLYVGTGRYGESRLREYRFRDMHLKRERRLPPALFGEGITRLGDSIYQLTWLSRIGLVYDALTFEPTRQWQLRTEGWGLTNDGQTLIYSDGSHRLRFLDPQTLEELRVLEVTLNGQPLPRLNELEWIDGEVWANVYQSEQLVRIDPDSGAVTGIVDLRGLLTPEERVGSEVLNGIAWDRGRGALWVTGKRWPWLFRVALRPRTANAGEESR